MFFKHKPRRGVALVEFAMVSSLTAFILLALFVGAMGIFRYQQVAALARETARYASLHATQYRAKTNPMTDEQVYENVIVPRAMLLKLDRLTYSIAWADANKGLSYLDPETNHYVPNSVTVTITYNWKPELFLGSITLSSTSTATVSN